jgi:O-antigen/teichoic acid export membrane protein
MAMPSTLIGKSVGDVFYPRINDAARSGENITRLLIKASSILAVVGFLPFTIIVIFGPWVFSQVFGSEWGVSGEYARYLSLFFYLNLINRPSVSAVPMLGLQKGLLLYEIVSTGGKVIGLMIGFYIYKSDVMAIMLFSIIGALTYLWMIAWIIYRSKGWKSEKASR